MTNQIKLTMDEFVKQDIPEKNTGSVIEEKWMFIIRRYPDGRSFPVNFFKLGQGNFKKKKNESKKKEPIPLSESVGEVGLFG